MKDNKFIFESNRNPYQLTDEISDFAQKQIEIASEFLMEFFKAKNYVVNSKRTYQINAPKGRIKIASYKTDFLRENGEKCSVEISNPYEFIGSRFWTHFRGKGAYWTDKNILINKNISSDVVFNLLAQNYEWIYRRVELVHINKLKGEEIDTQDSRLMDIDYSPIVDDSPKIISDKQKEDVAFEVFEKIFNGK